MNQKILLSLGVIALLGAVVAGGTAAFFSDTETSSGNTFTAGAIDLQIDNESYYNGEANASTTWEQAQNLDDSHLFFDFGDLKPGDWGEDTISLHVGDNDAYACMDVNLTATDDNGLTEPEAEDGDESENEGELQNEINFVWWNDDGDNVLETGEEEDSARIVTLSDMDEWSLPISDTSDGSLFKEPLVGGQTEYIAKAWCFGDLELDPADESDENDPTQVSGINCDGANLDNTTQTDSVEGNVTFTAVQSRHNEGFRCDERETDDDQNEPSREITGENGSSWPGSTESKDWIAKGRYGDNIGTTGSYELEVGDETSSGRTTGNFEWTDNQTHSWTLTYDNGTGVATLNVDGEEISQSVIQPSGSSFLSIIAKTHDDNDNGTSVVVSNVQLDSMSPVGSDSVTASTTSGERGLEHLNLMGDLELIDGFTLTGDLKFDWGNNPRDEGPAFMIVIGSSS